MSNNNYVYKRPNVFKRIMKNIKGTIKSVPLCIRFPFLYPRNRWSDMHAHSYTLYKLMNDAYTKAWQCDIYKDEEGNPHVSKELISRKWLIIHQLVKFWFKYPYQLLHCLPTYTELDAMPTGWRKAFGIQMCKDIRKALLEHGGYKELFNYRIMQIKEKYGCYDEQTEILTKDGWKYFKDLTDTDEVMSYNPETLVMEYQKPTDIVSYLYEGLMYGVQNELVDLLVTPQHNLYTGILEEGVHEPIMSLQPAMSVTGKQKYFQQFGNWRGNNDVPELSHFDLRSIVTLCAVYMSTEGAYIKDGELVLPYKGEDDCRGTLALLKGMQKYPKMDVETKTLTVTDKEVLDVLYECGHEPNEFKVPKFIKNLGPRLIERFCDALYKRTLTKQYKDTFAFYTTSKQFADDLCELLLKCRSSFNMRQVKMMPSSFNMAIETPSFYVVEWLDDKHLLVETGDEFMTNYKGNVYCVTVPNHIVYIRRNGKGIWCGNSLRWYDGGSNEAVHEIISEYEAISLHTCIDCGKPATAMSNGWISPYCDDCKSPDGNYTPIDKCFVSD